MIYKEKNRNGHWFVFLFLIVIPFLNSCSTKLNLYLPIGRLQQHGNNVQITIDGVEQHVDIIEDDHSGSWLEIPFKILKRNSKIVLLIEKKNSTNILNIKESNLDLWISPSDYIDSDNQMIIDKANELTIGTSENLDKIKSILDFVYNNIQYKLVSGMKKDFKKASETLIDGYGICMNKARLFVALCRACGIPARIICGSMINKEGSDHHHDWVEVYDIANNKWFPLDPTVSDSLDISTLMLVDVIYNIDNNRMFPFSYWANNYAIIEDGISIFFPLRNLHWSTGAVGYKVTEYNSEHIFIEIEYYITDSLLKSIESF